MSMGSIFSEEDYTASSVPRALAAKNVAAVLLAVAMILGFAFSFAAPAAVPSEGALTGNPCEI